MRKLHFALFAVSVGLAAGLATQASAIPVQAAPLGDYVTGCSGQYYNNTTLTGSPVFVRTDPAINFYWPEGASPGPGVAGDHYSVRWTCTINVATAGSYIFTMVTDDGMNLLIDGNLLMWAFYDQGPSTYSSSLYLNAGAHTVMVEYYNATLGGTARVYSNISGGSAYYAPPQPYYAPPQPYYNQPPPYYPQPQPYYYNQPPQLVITADNGTIARGQCTIVHWAVAYVQWFTVNGNNSSSNPGAMQVCPPTTTNYVLQAGSPYGNFSRTVTVNVVATPSSPYNPYYPPWFPNWRR
jgi:hypothetical protein